MEIKQQLNEKVTSNVKGFFGKRKQTDEHSKTQQKPYSNQTQLTRTGRNAVLAKYAVNDWLTYDRRGITYL